MAENSDSNDSLKRTAVDEEDIEEIISRLDEQDIKADREIGEDDGNSNGTEEQEDVDEKEEDEDEKEKNEHKNEEERQNGVNGAEEEVEKSTEGDDRPKNGSESTNGSPDKTTTPQSEEKRIKNPFKFLKRLSVGGSRDKAEREKAEMKKRKQKLDKVLSNVKVDSLPQVFVTKYLGSRQSKGLYGIKFTREPVESLVKEISSNKRGVDLPLLQIHVSTRGLHMTPHKANKCEELPIDAGLLPIEFISYGVQDIKYTRIFSYIVVREMSSKSKTLECHALLCDSVVTARRLALSVALAFKEYAKTLQGKPFKFKVDLRSPGELEMDLDGEKEEEEEDCEA